MRAKYRQLTDPRWAKWQVYCAGVPVGKPILAVSANQAVQIILLRTGRVMIGHWTAERVSLTQEELTDLAEFDETFPRPRRRNATCPACGYFDPSPMADVCPSCDTLRYENPD